MATYINKLASDKKIIDYLRNRYGVSDNPTDGESQVIFRDGKFLNNHDYPHGEILRDLYDEGLLKPNKHSYSWELVHTNLFAELGLIRCNSNFNYVYAKLPDIRPTEEQFESFEKWLDTIDLNRSGIEISVSNEIKFYSDEDITTDYIIKRIKRYYSSGKLYESGYDDYLKNFDYGTGERQSDDDIFDTKQTGISYWNQFLRPDDLKYLQGEENKTGSIVLMSPREYIRRCSSIIFKGRVSYSDLLTQRRDWDREKIDYLVDFIRNKKRKLCMPFLDYAEHGQEGLHRMIAAGEEFGFDHKFPVLVVDWLDKEKHKRDVEDRRRWEIEAKIERAFKEASYYHYDNVEEFIDEMQIAINHAWYVEYKEPDKEFSYDIKDNEITITVDGVSKTFDMSDIDIRNEETSNDDPFDDIDISDIDLVM